MNIQANNKEMEMWLPGDELILRPKDRITYAIDIHSDAENIFPWLKQMGCRRAGWYSYDQLDNAGLPSAEQVIPKLQNIHVGDYLPASTVDPPGVGFKVEEMQENKYLVLSNNSHFPSMEPVIEEKQPKQFWRTTWSFCLKKIKPYSTRLIVRSNIDYRPWWVYFFVWLIARPIHYFMQKKQLLNIKDRAEHINTLTPAY